MESKIFQFIYVSTGCYLLSDVREMCVDKTWKLHSKLNIYEKNDIQLMGGADEKGKVELKIRKRDWVMVEQKSSIQFIKDIKY